MIRSIWGVSAGESIASDASTGQRILITHRDGSQTVEYVEEAIGAGGENAIMRRLHELGAKNIASIEPLGVPRKSENGHDTRSSINISSNRITNIENGQRKPSIQEMPYRRSSFIDRGHSGPARFQRGGYVAPPARNLSVCLERIRKELILQAGVRGIRSLTREFRTKDRTKGGGKISHFDFRKRLHAVGVNVSGEEMHFIFENFDRARTGSMLYEEFLKGVRGELSPRRLALVKLAFVKLAGSLEGTVSRDHVKNAYDVSKHPDVLFSKRHAQQIFAEFVDTFTHFRQSSNNISFSDWKEYFGDLSASIKDDEYFDLTMRSVWNLGTVADRRAASREGRAMICEKSILSSTREKQPPPHPHHRTASAMLPVNGISTGSGTGTGMGALHRIKQQSFKRSYATAPRRPIPPEVVQVMHQVRDYLASRGVRSLHKLVQSLRECCNDRTATVSQHELHRAFQLCGARVHDEDLALIFAHFNHDATGSIDFHEFMIGFIGELNARRLKLVRAAFNKLDSLGSGNLRAATAIQSFDAAVHLTCACGSGRQSKFFENFMIRLTLQMSMESCPLMIGSATLRCSAHVCRVTTSLKKS